MNHRFLTAVLAVLLAAAASANENGSDGGDPTDDAARSDRFDLGVIEVTGAQGPDDGLEYPGVEVLTTEEMQRQERYDVAEALNLLPGVTAQNVGNRSESLVFLRGFDSRQVGLFVDGIPVYVPYDGNIDLGRFLTQDLSEIRVTKGFTSVLYGPNTLAGSINLVTRRPVEPFEARVGTGFVFDSDGDHAVRRANASIGGNYGDWYFQANGSWRDRDHFRLSDDYRPGGAEDGGKRDNSATEDTNVSLKLGYTPNQTDEYALSYYRQDGEKQTPPYAGRDPSVRTRFWRWPFYDKESLYFLSRTATGGESYVRLRAYYDTFENLLSSFDDDSYTTQNRRYAFNSIYDDYTWGGGAEFGFRPLANHLVKLAANYKRDVHRESEPGGPRDEYEDETWSVAIEDTITLSESLQVIGGVSWNRQENIRADNRIDEDTVEQFDPGSDDAVNLQLGVFWEPVANTELHFTVGRKTRFPTIKDRYSFRFGSALPNPDLAAEEADNYELGFERTGAMVRYGGNLFFSSLTDAIENVTLSDDACIRPPCFQLQNVEEQENSGVELWADWDATETLLLHLDYTYLDRDNISNPELRPVDTPEHKVFGFARYSPTPFLYFQASAEYNDKRFSETNGSRVAESFTVANTKASWEARNGFAVDVGVRNIADENYAYEEGYPEPGRTWFLNLRYRYR